MFHKRVVQDNEATVGAEMIKNEKYTSQKQKRIWKWIAAGAVAIVVIIVAIVVPIEVTKNNNAAQQSQAVSTTTTSASTSTTATSTTQHPKSSTKSSTPSSTSTPKPESANIIDTGTTEYPVSPYAHQTSIITNNSAAINSKKRVFVLGDLHGCIDEFNQMLKTLNYTSKTDQIILAGDITAKGPDSIGVIRRAQEIGALCVRGNHDDKVIRLKTYELENGRDAMQPPNATMPEGNVADPLTFDNYHTEISFNMTQKDYDYLSSCPIVLHLPYFNNSMIVHGGLDPSIPDLEDQISYLIMNMRDIDDDMPTDDNSAGTQWAKVWNKDQEDLKSNENNTFVFYGHDASRGLNIKDYTFGVDSGCVYGRKLSAINIITKELTQIKCEKYAE